MDELKTLVVDQLVKETDPDKQIRILQEINKTILTKYVIQIGNYTIEPLWVEAYYYDSKTFQDCNTHMSDKQKSDENNSRFGKLYFHEKGRGGLDICLPMHVDDHEDYYLSVLLKATLIYETGKRCLDEKAFKKQTEIYDILTEKDIKEMKIVLVEKDKDDVVLNAVRVNLQKPYFKDALLASCLLDSLDLLENNNFDFPNGYKKQWKCSVRALSEEPNDEVKAREKAKTYNGATIENKYWDLAKESLGYND